MSTLIDTLAGMKDARVAEIAQLGRTMNKRRKDILAYFDTKSMHSKTGRATKRGYFAGFFLALHTKSLSDRPFEQIWCEVPSFSGVAHPPTPANPSQAMIVKTSRSTQSHARTPAN
ncbi:transposase [Corynebacterium diphtheriae]|uniref:transposase n=1 Tax=Corynebacterium diphtheriae TaxID=1717 RepID=UPI00403DB553